MLHSATSGLPELSVGSLFTQFEVSPPLLAFGVAVGFEYARRARRLDGGWPRRRTASLILGLVVALWVGCGGPSAYAGSLFWMWTAQMLALLLVVPVLLVAAQPVELGRQTGAGWLLRLVESRPARLLGHPLIGPVAIPLASVALFFGPLSGWSVAYPPVGWIVQLVAVALGALVVLPLLDVGITQTSLYAGLALAVGVGELLIDAIPGIVLRLQTHLVSSFPDYRQLHGWSPTALHDQQNAGTVLWSVAELIDLPFLLIAFRRWQRHDAREAAVLDAVLDADLEAQPEGGSMPWWISDPQMQRRRSTGPGDQTEKEYR